MTRRRKSLYVAAVPKAYRWHLAAYEPTGYGTRSLCGLIFREGHYRTHGPGVAPPVCERCKAAA